MDRQKQVDIVTSAEAERAVYQPGNHIPQLDGLRGLAILLVSVYRFGLQVPTDGWTGHALSTLWHAGQYGVELFFVLSGFLITGILLDSRGAPHQLRNFFMRRSLRILPLYVATLTALSLAMWSLGSSPEHVLLSGFRAAYQQQIYLWFYLTNIRMSWLDSWCFGPLDHFWSLAVEEHFYLVWPLIVAFCLPRQLLRLAIMGAIAALLLRTSWLISGGSATAAEVLTIMRCDGLLLGAAIAIAVRQWTTEHRKPNGHRIGSWALLVGVACVLIGLAVAWTQRRLLMTGSVIWTLGWSALLIALVTGQASSRWARLLNQQWLRSLGQLSYAMYIFQSPLIPLCTWLLVELKLQPSTPVSSIGSLWYIGSMLGLTIALAWCSWHLFEKHWLRLKTIFPQTRPASEPNSMDSGGAPSGSKSGDSLVAADSSNIVPHGSCESRTVPWQG